MTEISEFSMTVNGSHPATSESSLMDANGFISGIKYAYRKKYIVVACALLVAGLTYYSATKLTPLYSSTLTLAVEGAYEGDMPWNNSGGAAALDKVFLNTEYEYLISRDLAERVADAAGGLTCDSRALRLSEKWGGAPDQPPSILNQVRKGVEVAPVRNTVLFRISATCDDPESAKALADLYAAEYVAARRELFQDDRSQASGWMQERLVKLEEDLAAAEQELQQFKEQQQVASSRLDGGLESIEIRQLLEAHTSEKQKQAQLEPLLAELESLGEFFLLEDLLAIERIREDPIVSPLLIDLTGISANLNGLKELYHPEHPEVKSEQIRYDQLVLELKRQLSIVTAGLRRNLRESKQASASLQRSINQAKSKSIIADRSSANLQNLENQVLVKRQIYEQFLAKLNDPTLAQGFTGNRIRVSGKAYVAGSPSFPDPPLFAVLAFVLSSFLGTGVAFTRGVARSVPNTSPSITDSFGSRVLGLVPYMRSFDGLEPIDNYISDRSSSFSEAIRVVRDSLASLGPSSRNRVTVLVSAFAGEGKTTIALNLAAAFAQMQRVLVVNADYSKSASNFGNEMQPRGLLNVLSGQSKIADCIVRSEGGEYDVLPIGWLSSRHGDLSDQKYTEESLIATPRYGRLLSALSRNYDHVIIDTGSLKNCQASRAIASHSTHLLYVIAASNANLQYAREGLAMLGSWNAAVAGVILNKVEVNAAGYAVQSRRNAKVYSLANRE